MTIKCQENILAVDDDPNLLVAIKRQFRGEYNVVTAEGGAEGLRLISKHSPFAVVVSDMRMPEMNGIQFLAQVSKLSPDTTRVMLTGNADLDTAMHAVNEGNIFRFLVKPCHKTTMSWAIDSAVKQYRLVKAERELLEGTLKGSIQVLTDILASVNPVAFSRTSRVQKYVRQIAQHLELSNVWQYELAALLSQVGCVTLPADTLDKFVSGVELTENEKKMIREHPAVGHDLLEKIPRLEVVAEMIGQQCKPYKEYALRGALPKQPELLGAIILKATLDFDLFVSRGLSKSQAIDEMNKQSTEYCPHILGELRHLMVIDADVRIRVVETTDLDESMILAEDIRTDENLLLAAKGQQVTRSMRGLLNNFISQGRIKKTTRIIISADQTEESAVKQAPVSA